MAIAVLNNKTPVKIQGVRIVWMFLRRLEVYSWWYLYYTITYILCIAMTNVNTHHVRACILIGLVYVMDTWKHSFMRILERRKKRTKHIPGGTARKLCEANLQYWMGHVYCKKEWIVCNMYLAKENPKHNKKSWNGLRGTSAAFLVHN
jgi:hypothetical protein